MKKRPDEIILLMLSGGLDSSYLLYKYLTETDKPIHVHHISHRCYIEPRWKQEDLATQRVVAYCRNIRNFDYSESRFDFPPFRIIGWDSDLQLLVAQKIGINLRAKKVRVAIGTEAGQIYRSEINRRIMPGGPKDILWTALCNTARGLNRKLINKISCPLLETGIDKSVILALCPEELIKMSWSCRTPDKKCGESCGHCHSCKDLRYASKRLKKMEIFTTEILCFECGRRLGVDYPGRKPDEIIRCPPCLIKFMNLQSPVLVEYIERLDKTMIKY